jgi:hypothetical protein
LFGRLTGELDETPERKTLKVCDGSAGVHSHAYESANARSPIKLDHEQ